ncbi:MAG TPA: VanW family protein [Acidimicrobiia bacterium]|nr:VanW family protein [Acidimicrobiia bacterium]
MARHRDRTNGWLWVLPALLIPVVVASVAWTAHVSSEGRTVAPNVTFAGLDISGLSPSGVAEHVRDRELDLLSTPVIVDLGERRVVMTADEVGYDYLYNETVTEVVSARHGDGAWTEFVAWAATPFSTISIEDRYVLDEDDARDRLSRDDFVLADPVEPSIAMGDSMVELEPGVDGVGIDVDALIDTLAIADVASGVVDVEAELVPIAPNVSDDVATEVVEDINVLTRPGFLAIAGDRSAHLTPEQVRSHLQSTTDDEMRISLDMSGFQETLEARFPEPIGELVPPELEVVDGEVVMVSAGEPPQVCCSRESVERAAMDYLSGGPSWHVIETRTSTEEPHIAWANGTNVTQPVAQFTTYHACCENRVVNIQTIADKLTGKYLIPGETLSLNEFVGPRTSEKGYVPAGAIRGGHMTDEVGGGVSQFVTTIFNAAFFAGLDLDEYQSHSVYFSRYPFGREATLSVPGPDLVITNNTDHPVLIWPTYTPTSITVTFYSTPNVEVEELDQRVSFRNQCRHSQIDRQRTFSDGRVVVDTIVANYRPGDGLDCSGNVIPER